MAKKADQEINNTSVPKKMEEVNGGIKKCW
jgi:hypothetical protein